MIFSVAELLTFTFHYCSFFKNPLNAAQYWYLNYLDTAFSIMHLEKRNYA